MLSHQRSTYHKEVVADGEIQKILESRSNRYRQNGISKRQTQIKENRERVASIIESILFLGRQNIVLRVRDHGRTVSTKMSALTRKGCHRKREGNFESQGEIWRHYSETVFIERSIKC